MNFFQTYYKFLVNFWQTSDKFLMKFSNFLWASFKLLTNFSWTSYKLLMNFLQTSHELLTRCNINFWQELRHIFKLRHFCCNCNRKLVMKKFCKSQPSWHFLPQVKNYWLSDFRCWMCHLSPPFPSPCCIAF
jgi:hypothetical protein